MKRILGLFLLGILFLPSTVFARELKVENKKYEVLNYEETLKDAKIEKAFDNYVETDEQVPIYLFRGKNCEYCKYFLQFLNNNTNEYGKYFKLISFEIYSDKKNVNLLKKIANYVDATADGVPFIIIGDHFFEGYSEEYNDKIIEAIMTNYQLEKSSRPDVIESVNQLYNSKSTGGIFGNKKIVAWNFIFIVLSTAVILFFVNKKIDKLDDKISMIRNNGKK